MGFPSKNGSRYNVYSVLVLQVPNSASILSLIAREVELAKKKKTKKNQKKARLLGQRLGKREEEPVSRLLTGDNWTSRGAEAESLEPLSGGLVKVPQGCLAPATVITDHSLEWSPNQSPEDSEQAWARPTLVPHSSLVLSHICPL